jgi:hypothetical protein
MANAGTNGTAGCGVLGNPANPMYRPAVWFVESAVQVISPGYLPGTGESGVEVVFNN